MSSSAPPKYPEKPVNGPILTKSNGVTYQLTTNAITPRVATTEKLQLDLNYLRTPDSAKEPIYPIRQYYYKDSNDPHIIQPNQYIVKDNGHYILHTISSNSAAAGLTPLPVEVFITPSRFRKIGETNTKSVSTQPKKEMYGADPAKIEALRASIQAKKNAKKSPPAKSPRKRSTRKRRSSRQRRA